AHTADGAAAARLRAMNGIRPLSTRPPSQDTMAGNRVSEPVTAMPTTMMAPTAIPLYSEYPVRNSPASAVMTVRPDTTIARPDVRAATATAWCGDGPRAR